MVYQKRRDSEIYKTIILGRRHFLGKCADMESSGGSWGRIKSSGLYLEIPSWLKDTCKSEGKANPYTLPAKCSQGLSSPALKATVNTHVPLPLPLASVQTPGD